MLRIKPDLSRDKDTEIYDKWTQALDASRELCINARSYAEKFRAQHAYTAILPIVAIPDDTLWMVEYGEDGQVAGDPKPAEYCEFYADRQIVLHPPGHPHYQTFTFSHINFATMGGLKKFTDKLKGDYLWRDLFGDTFEE
jgi:hypothetical protein